MIRRGIIACCVLALFSNVETVAETPSSSTRIITDMERREVALPRVISRALGTGGALDAWFLMLGSMDKLVGSSAQLIDNAWFAKIYPAVRELPVIYSGNQVDKEALVAAALQVALLLNGVSARREVEQSGVPIVMLERDDPAQLEEALELVGRVLGERELRIAREFRSYYESNVVRVRERTGALPPQRIRRVYYAATAPLVTEGSRSIVSSWIETAGGINVAGQAGVSGIGKTVQLEDILQWNPEVIIAFLPAVRDQILADPRWRSIDAVKNGRVVVNPRGVYPWCTRSAEEALQTLWAAKTLHPELFDDIDLVQETQIFHAKFYHYDLGRDDAERMLRAAPPVP